MEFGAFLCTDCITLAAWNERNTGLVEILLNRGASSRVCHLGGLTCLSQQINNEREIGLWTYEAGDRGMACLGAKVTVVTSINLVGGSNLLIGWKGSSLMAAQTCSF